VNGVCEAGGKRRSFEGVQIGDIQSGTRGTAAALPHFTKMLCEAGFVFALRGGYLRSDDAVKQNDDGALACFPFHADLPFSVALSCGRISGQPSPAVRPVYFARVGRGTVTVDKHTTPEATRVTVLSLHSRQTG